MTYKCILLAVEDIEKSRKFYENVLGLTLDMDFGENVSFKEGIAIHKKNHLESIIDHKVMLSKAHSHELFFEEDDIETIYDLVKTQMEIVHELREQPWLQRVFRFYDYDHHMIEIGESMEAVVRRLSVTDEPQTIAGKIGMPLAFVKKVLL